MPPKGKRISGTIKDKVGVNFQVCYRCGINKDVIEYTPYWYQPNLGGKPHGERVRRRYKTCKVCSGKGKKSDSNSKGSEDASSDKCE